MTKAAQTNLRGLRLFAHRDSRPGTRFSRAKLFEIYILRPTP